jgi:broad specificity phosphatase PhoE
VSRLLIVRHGQASFGAPDYDQLSPLGRRQARLLGQYLAQSGLSFDQVYLGPKQRHHQTQEAVAAVYREGGLRWPEPIETPGLDEHCGAKVLKCALLQLSEQETELKAAAQRVLTPHLASADDYARIFQKVTRLWARGEIASYGFESWREFRQRVKATLTEMFAHSTSERTVIAFTSAGAVSATVGYVLGLDD